MPSVPDCLNASAGHGQVRPVGQQQSRKHVTQSIHARNEDGDTDGVAPNSTATPNVEGDCTSTTATDQMLRLDTTSVTHNNRAESLSAGGRQLRCENRVKPLQKKNVHHLIKSSNIFVRDKLHVISWTHKQNRVSDVGEFDLGPSECTPTAQLDDKAAEKESEREQERAREAEPIYQCQVCGRTGPYAPCTVAIELIGYRCRKTGRMYPK
eukprot:GFYU01012206.1.p1 GENE.GFYU01012206.1~~GFYU01012206.1.p1  ORF type:complete len:210 (+),score=18.19 GFYU01012206.1:41-670(+)